MIAGSLEIQMLANLAELRKQMDQASGIVQSGVAQIQKAADLAGKALGLIGVGLSAAAFTGFIRNAIDAADALDEMSGRIGVSAKELSGLQLVYRQAGMGNDAMTSSLAKLSQEMSQGNVGLRALQVNARNADGSLRGTTSVLLDIADKFAKMEDGAGKTAIAMEIFGKSGAEMVPLLSSGAEGIRELIAMSEKLGLVIEDETAAKAGQFNDTLELLGLGVQGVGTRVAAQLLPTLTNLAGSFLESMTQGDGLRKTAEFLATALKGLYTVGVSVVEVFNTLGKAAAGGFGAILAALQGDFAGAKRILEEAKTDILGGWAATAKTISKAWNEEGDAAVAAASKIIKSNKDLLADQKAREETDKKSAKETEQVQKQFDALLESVIKVTAGYQAEDAAGEKLTEGQKKAVEVLEQLRTGKLKVSQANAVMLGQALESMLAAEGENREREEFLKIAKAEADARMKIATAAEQGVQSMLDQNRTLREEIELIGLSAEQQEAILRGRRETVILIKEAALAELERQAAVTGTMTREHVALMQEIEQLKERNELLGQKALRERETQGWADFYGSIEHTGHAVFVDVAKNGMDAFKRIGKTIKASVLDVLWQMVGRKWMISIGTSVFGSGFAQAAQAATGGTSALSTLGNIGGIYSGLSSMSTAGMLPAAMSGLLTTAGATSSFAAGLGGAWGAGGGLMSTLNAGASLLGSGSIASGLGTLAGALGPIALGIAALAAIFGKKSTPHMGASAQFSAAGGLETGTAADLYGMGFGAVAGNAKTETMVGQIAQGLASALDSVATEFGTKAGFAVATAFADDTSKDGAWGGLRIALGGVDLVNWNQDRDGKWAPREFANGEEGLKQYAAALAGSVKEVLGKIGLPEWAARIAANMPDTGSADDLNNTLAAIKAYPGQLLQRFGSDRDSLVQLYVQGLATGNAVEAGQSVADALVINLRNALFAQGAGAIFDTVNRGIVAPMLDAIATGASVSEALSAASIAATIERAKAQAAVLAELLGNAEFQNALSSMRDAVASALGQAGASLQSLPYTVQTIDTAAQSAAQAASDAANAWQAITDGLIGDRKQLAIDLLRAMGQEEAALAAERSQAVAGMDAYQTALWDANAATRAQIAALERQAEIQRAIADELPDVLDAYRSQEGRTAARYADIADSLAQAGFSVTADALVAASKETIARVATEVYNLGGTSDEARLAILRAAGALASLKDEAAEATKADALSRLDSAWQAFQRSVEARRSALQETIADIRTVFDMVRQAARDLYGDVAQTAALQYQQGRAFISQALATASSTGYLPDADQLRDAISSARAGLDGREFATQAEGDYQRMVLAAELSALGDISGEQLSEAERQLEALDALLAAEQLQMEALRAQIDATYEGTAATLSVEDAVERLNATMAHLMGSAKATGAGGAGAFTSDGTASVGWANLGVGDWLTTASAAYDIGNRMLYTQDGGAYDQGSLRSLAGELIAAGQNDALAGQLQKYGFSLSDADTLFGLDAGAAQAWAKANGIPAFAGGGVHGGGWALVGEDGPEFAYMPPARIYTASETARMQASGGGEDPLAVKLDELTTVVRQGKDATETVRDVLVKVTANGSAMAVETI